ncbi:hypothetical protein DV738_g860, partial [Chaetothyriales sp. CBS 135597]
MATSTDTSLAELLIPLLNQVMQVLREMVPLIPTYTHLIASAVFPIYTASHASLTRPSSAAAPTTSEGEEKKSQLIEGLTPGDALVFPLLAGGILASLYFLLKWLQDPYWVNTLLSLYFAWTGLFFAFKFLRDVLYTLRSLVFPSTYSSARGRQVWKAEPAKRAYTTASGLETSSPLPGFLRHIPLGRRVSAWVWRARGLLSTPAALHLGIGSLVQVDTTITLVDVVALVVSCGVVAVHTFVAKPWYLTNFLGFSFSYGALQFMTPTTGWTGTLVLSALFVYDIYFVFFTPMMVTVATKLDVPIKLLFPQPDGCVLPPSGTAEDSAVMQAYRECLAKKRAMAMLGLGDIVVPGMMIAFALRFDLFLHYRQLARKSSTETTPTTSNGKTETVKAEYRSATGAWGERFWTAKTAWSEQLQAKSFRKRYFYATLAGYVAGLAVTLVALQVMQHGQPALLYLVPGVLGMFWGTALLRGELKTLWNFSEAEEDEDSKEDEKTKVEDAEGERPSSQKLVDFSISLLTAGDASDNLPAITAPSSVD